MNEPHHPAATLEQENDAAAEALRAAVLGGLRAKARFIAVFVALAVGMFVYVASDTGQPMWLIVLIGVLGAVLIGFFIALVWFWLRFFSHFGRKS